MCHLLAVDESLSTRWFVSQFVFGLRDDIRAAVRLQSPSSIARAASLARIQEEEIEHHRPRGSGTTSGTNETPSSNSWQSGSCYSPRLAEEARKR